MLYVPDLRTNVLSIAAVTELGMTVHFIKSLVSFNNSGKPVIVGKRIGKTLYHLAITASPSDESAYLASPAPPSIAVGDQRFARDVWPARWKGPLYPIGRSRAVQVGKFIHSDLCGPMHVETPDGARFYVLFTNDFSGYRTVFFLKQKLDVAECFKEFTYLLPTETGQLIHTSELPS